MVLTLPGPFLVGLNLPWLDYGVDFGANAWQPEGGLARPERRRRLRDALGGLADRGVTALRWFLMGDGRAGLHLDGDGYPLGLDHRFFPDLDAAIELARAARLRLLFTLIDFLWFDRSRTFRGVRLGGRRHLVRTPALRSALLERVFLPILERYGHEDAIVAWDVINEPEWATLGVGTWNPRRSVTRSSMRAFIGDVVGLAHRHAAQPVTVGSAGLATLDLVRGLDLDFYQVHWYDSVEKHSPLETPVASLGLDGPLLLGEYPTRGSSRRADAILATAAACGYAGAFAWSLLAEDEASDRPVCEAVGAQA